MPYIWRYNLELGVPAVDQQHKRLIVKINNLIDAMERGEGLDELRNSLRFVESYITRHFHAEESFMMSIGYPDLPSHILEHEYFKREFQKLKRDIHANGANLRTLMLTERMLCSWINEHIYRTDLKIAVYVREERKSSSRAA